MFVFQSCEEDSDCGNKSKCSKVVDDDKLRKCKDSEDTSDCFCSVRSINGYKLTSIPIMIFIH